MTKAQTASDSKASDPSSMVSNKGPAAKLHGGLFFSGKRGPLVVQRDISRTLSYACAFYSV